MSNIRFKHSAHKNGACCADSVFLFLQLQKITIDSIAVCQFRVKTGRQQLSLPGSYDMPCILPQNFCLFANLFYPRSSDKYKWQRFCPQSRQQLPAAETVELTAIRITTHGNIRQYFLPAESAPHRSPRQAAPLSPSVLKAQTVPFAVKVC